MPNRPMDRFARLAFLLATGLAAGVVGCAPAEEKGADAGDSSNSRRDSGSTTGSPDSSAVVPTVDSGMEWPRPDGGALPDGGAKPDGGGIRPDGGVVATCTGKPGAQRGKVRATVQAGGTQRTFIYYAPTDLDPNKAVPVILSPHGFAMKDEDMYTLTGFREIADREGLVAIFPNGNSGDPWNVGSGVSGAGALVANPLSDDQAFIDAIIAYAEADQCIDKKHIFVSGFSMGGYFSNENGCLRSDIASIGPHSGGSHDLTSCSGSIKPVIVFHGDADLLITYQENGVLARDRWVERNGCGKEVESRSVNGGTCDYNKGCPAHAQVALCHFDGMGHAWAGGKGTANSDPSKENAAELAWKFWKEYAW